MNMQRKAQAQTSRGKELPANLDRSSPILRSLLYAIYHVTANQLDCRLSKSCWWKFGAANETQDPKILKYCYKDLLCLSSLWSRLSQQTQNQWATEDHNPVADWQKFPELKRELQERSVPSSRAISSLQRGNKSRRAVNWRGRLILLSKLTAPTLSGKRPSDLESGVKPSVKMTASTFLDPTRSIGRGGPSDTSLFHWTSDSRSGGSAKKSEPTGKRIVCLWEITRRKAQPTFPHSFPAEPGSRSPDSKIMSISWTSSSRRAALISSCIQVVGHAQNGRRARQLKLLLIKLGTYSQKWQIRQRGELPQQWPLSRSRACDHRN